ncbi:MAG: hypothetical protein PVF43_01705 [Candidatus Eiseniibacteriota bacterium]
MSLGDMLTASAARCIGGLTQPRHGGMVRLLPADLRMVDLRLVRLVLLDGWRRIVARLVQTLDPLRPGQ